MNIELAPTQETSKNSAQAPQEDEFRSTEDKSSSFKKLRNVLIGVIPIIAIQNYISFRLYSIFPDSTSLAQLINGFSSGLVCFFLRYYASFHIEENQGSNKEKLKNPPRALAFTLSFLSMTLQIIMMSVLHTFMTRASSYLDIFSPELPEYQDLAFYCRTLLFIMMFMVSLFGVSLGMSYKDLTLEKSEYIRIQNIVCLFLTISSFGVVYQGADLQFYANYPFVGEIFPTWVLDLSVTNGIMTILIGLAVWYLVQKNSAWLLVVIALFTLFATIINMGLMYSVSDYSSQVRETFANTQDENWITMLSMVNQQELAYNGCEKYLPNDGCSLDLIVDNWENSLLEPNTQMCLNIKCAAIAGDMFQSHYMTLKYLMIASTIFLLVSIINMIVILYNDPSKFTVAERSSMRRNSCNFLALMSFTFLVYSFRGAFIESDVIEIYPGSIRDIEASNYLASHPVIKTAFFKFNQEDNQLETYMDRRSLNAMFDIALEDNLEFLVLTPFLTENNELLLTSTSYDSNTSRNDIPQIMSSNLCGVAFVKDGTFDSKNVKVMFYAKEETPSMIKDTIFGQFSTEGEIGREPKTTYYFVKDSNLLNNILNSSSEIPESF